MMRLTLHRVYMRIWFALFAFTQYNYSIFFSLSFLFLLSPGESPAHFHSIITKRVIQEKKNTGETVKTTNWNKIKCYLLVCWWTTQEKKKSAIHFIYRSNAQWSKSTICPQQSTLDLLHASMVRLLKPIIPTTLFTYPFKWCSCRTTDEIQNMQNTLYTSKNWNYGFIAIYL